MDNQPSDTAEELSVVTFRKELTDLINKHSLEQYCNTPDFILADYLVACFNNYCNVKNDNDQWFTPPTKKAREV